MHSRKRRSELTWLVVWVAALPLGCGGMKEGEERTAGRQARAQSLVVSDDGCSNVSAADGFVSTEFGYEGGTFWADFDATPSSDSIDAVMGFSDGPADSFSDLGVAVRFNPDGFIDARNGDAYGVYNNQTPISYHGGTTYHFHVQVDLRTRTYLATAQSADDFSYLAFETPFRTDQARALQITHRVVKIDSASGAVNVCNFQRTYGDRCFRTDAGGGWNNRPWWPVFGTATYRVTVKPTESNVDAVIGLGRAPSDTFSELAAIVRWNPAGMVDARNGSAYSAVSAIPYTGGDTYDLSMMLDVRARSYSATVNNGAVAQNFAFRSEQASVTALAYATTFIDSASGGVILCNEALTSLDRSIYTVPASAGQLAIVGGGPLYETHGSADGSVDVHDARTGAIVSSAPHRGVGRVDSRGDLYLAGTFDGTYDPGSGPLTSTGGTDVFIAKYAPDLTPLWAHALGTPGDDDFRDLAVDGRGNAAVLGGTLGTVVLDPNGVVLRQTQDSANHVALNAIGELAVSGEQRSETGSEIWIEKRTPDGATMWRNTYPAAEVSGLAIANNGDVAFSGRFRGTVNFGGADMQFHASEVTYGGYVVKLSPSGEHQWSRQTDHHERPSIVTTDVDGNVLYGATVGSQFVTADITKFANADGAMAWEQSVSDRGQTFSIATDVDGYVYWSFSRDDYAAGTSDDFVMKLAP